MNFYNEFDPSAAAWLRELISRGLIPAGVVDERSITDIQPHQLFAYTQCHFFAGIGGWSLALALAGWDSTRPVWTGSCPCQPYSAAGKGLGDDDPRNLWPAFFRLIRECRPDAVFGEQVESAIGHGWLDQVSADMEGEGYAVGAAVLGAHSVGAPHIRQRLYWVAHTELARREETGLRPEIDAGREPESGCTSGGLANSDGRDASPEREQCGGEQRREPGDGGGSHWSDSYWLPCRDGKHRRVPTEPALFPLADGLPSKLARRGSVRPALLKGAGNAIVPQVAAEFIGAHLDALKP